MRNHGKNARATCAHFHISPDTFYRWKKFIVPWFDTLEERPPTKTCQTATWTTEDVQAVQEIRESIHAGES